MSNQSLDTPDKKRPDKKRPNKKRPEKKLPNKKRPNPLRFKGAAGILLILLGTLAFLGAFAQMLSYIFYINNWFSVVLSFLQLLVALAVTLIGILTLMRRSVVEWFTPKAGIIGAATLIVLDLAGSLLMNGSISGAVLPWVNATAIFILLGLGLRHSRR